MSRAKSLRVPVEQRVRIVLSVLAGEVTMAEAARRHGVTSQAVMTWRDRFLEAGKAGLADRVPGPPGQGTHLERQLRAEAEQLKLALAEATVQLRIWQKGAEHLDEVPSKNSRP